EAPTVAEFAQRVEHELRKHEGLHLPPLVAAPRPDAIPLSFPQQRLWFLDQLEPENTAYLEPSTYRLQGMLDVQGLEQSLEELTPRQESLRTTFTVQADEPVQVIHPVGTTACPRLSVIDLQQVREDERAAVAEELLGQEASYPMDLTRGPL